MAQQFIGKLGFQVKDTEVYTSCPSNIALVKYWGKYANQIPANPSISYTLTHCKTNTKIAFRAGDKFGVQTFLSSKEEQAFAKKIEQYFISIEPYLPWVLEGSYVIHTENTFPHSSGIASSASGFGALAKGLAAMEEQFYAEPDIPDHKASFLARLGSGSACRSLYSGLAVWGEADGVEGSSNLFAVKYPDREVHPVFRDFNDWVLLVHKGQKSVSSTLGHSLMNAHPYAEARFREARENLGLMQEILKSGDMEGFITLIEHEALTLHSMMMMSRPAFILMKAGTVEVIHKIWDFRRETALPLFFTLDAGANVHLLFPNKIAQEDLWNIISFIETELLMYAQDGGLVKDKMLF